MDLIDAITTKLMLFSEPEKAKIFPKFFQTHSGGYGEGDQFLGVRVPNIRKVMKEYKTLALSQVKVLLTNEFHEIRMLALFILVEQMKKAKNDDEKVKIVDCYVKHTDYINNWDLVDCSAHKILGVYLHGKEKSLLYQLARSNNLWKQRIAIIASFWDIRLNQFIDALQVSEILLHHPHDLIHKAVGWMLREIGNRDRATEVDFLKNRYKEMPRTMLRYAIEKFEPAIRKKYLAGTI